jgi:hypothetical protein
MVMLVIENPKKPILPQSGYGGLAEQYERFRTVVPAGVLGLRNIDAGEPLDSRGKRLRAGELLGSDRQ